jgi:hypothetical protein
MKVSGQLHAPKCLMLNYQVSTITARKNYIRSIKEKVRYTFKTEYAPYGGAGIDKWYSAGLRDG